MTAATEATDTITEQARQFVALRNELWERGEVLAKELAKRKGRTVIVNIDGGYFELARTSLPGSRELPVYVTPAEVLG